MIIMRGVTTRTYPFIKLVIELNICEMR